MAEVALQDMLLLWGGQLLGTCGRDMGGSEPCSVHASFLSPIKTGTIPAGLHCFPLHAACCSVCMALS